MPEWNWDARSARYRDLTTGRYVSAEQVRLWSQMSMDASPVVEWAAQVAANELSVGAWQTSMRSEIKTEYIRQYLAGRGGLSQMTAKDWGSIGGMLSEQYKFLDKFAKEVAAGNLTEKQIANRSKMYINSAREAYERAKKRAAEEAGMSRVRWVEDPAPDVDHCEDCVAFANRGWQKAEPWPFKIGRENAMPGTGTTACKVNCRCWLDWKK